MAGAVAAQDQPGAAIAAGTSGSGKTPAQAMADLMGEMVRILATPVTMENQEEINRELAKLLEEMVKTQREVDAESNRLAGLQAQINNESKR